MRKEMRKEMKKFLFAILLVSFTMFISVGLLESAVVKYMPEVEKNRHVEGGKIGQPPPTATPRVTLSPKPTSPQPTVTPESQPTPVVVQASPSPEDVKTDKPSGVHPLLYVLGGFILLGGAFFIFSKIQEDKQRRF